MVRLFDGPVEGTYRVKRAPLFLRAVVDDGTGRTDVLDQLDEAPRPTERESVYKMQGSPSLFAQQFLYDLAAFFFGEMAAEGSGSFPRVPGDSECL